MHSAKGRSGNAIGRTDLFASSLSPFSPNAHANGLVAVCLIYCLVMGWLLFTSHFLPFVFDNNETFSSVIHAQNMASLPFRLTFGLTNESYGLDPAAHPYVYTHQGNFPRLFAFGLLLLGADTPQAQIVATTFTVGLASIVMAYLFVSRIASPFIALLYCGILLTDYIMSTQWWINTWRVWHFFLFFAFCHLALLIARSRARSIALVCAGLLSAVAVYTEIAFAAFVLAFFTIYLCWLARRSPRVCVYGISVAIFGAVLGAAVLLVQIGAYLGWEGLKTDLALTFSARNGAPGEQLNSFMDAVWDFMRAHNLVYWDNNILSSTPLRSPWVAITHYFRYNFLPYSPLVTFLSIAAVLVLVLAQAPTLLSASGLPAQWRRFVVAKRLPPEQAVAFVLPAVVFLMAVLLFGTSAFGFHHHQMPMYSEFLVALLASMIVAYLFATASASPFTFDWRNDAQVRRLSLGAGTFLVLISVIHASGWLGPFSYPSTIMRGVSLIALAVAFHALCTRAGRPMRLVSVWGCVVFCFVVAGLTRLTPALYDTSFGITGALFHLTWKGLVSRLGGFLVWQLVVCLTMMLGCMLILTRSGSPLAARVCRQFMPMVAVLIAGAMAFVAAYVLFPGYVFTAYQNRYCPFTVFINVIPLAALGVLLSAGIMQDAMSRSTPLAFGSVTTVRRLSMGLAVACIAYWGALQNTYLKAFPANRLSEFFAELQRMKGVSTVASTYAAPIAALTKSWSYFDPAFLTVSQKFDGRRFVMTPRDERYLWLADRDTNDAYKQPSHFVCWMHSNLHDLVLGATTCGTLPGIKAIRSKFQPYFSNVEVSRDKKRDLWSIVRLDYEAPGSLRRIYDDLEVRAIVVTDKVAGGWRLQPVFKYVHQDGVPLRNVNYVLETITCRFGVARRVKSDTLTEAELFLPASFSGIARLDIDVVTDGLKDSPWKSAVFIVGMSQEKSEECFRQSIADGLLSKADLLLYLEIDERGSPDRWLKKPASQLISPIRAE